MGFQNIVNFCTYPQSISILDAVYIRGDCYYAKKLYPISTSDHNSVLVIPKYTKKKRESGLKQKRKLEGDLSVESIRQMRSMIQSTD
ncbi:hypothetical protein HOLleu_05314 [Holothuria leucospilota]|uniref:Uncharacterized protein n=1 Tax=Holothuria leucospilota TaxID=206669 RepID=A0A9Q1HHB8_HOLLE|nr:hypothetical protein HOLleu_05314 [Holothuria leucospilota]